MASPRLKEKYRQEIIPQLKEQLHYKSVMQVPKLEKICINQGIGVAVSDKKLIDTAIEELSTITGQKAMPTKAKKAVSNFKLREGMPIGAIVTLRGDKMYEFLDRLITLALPRERGFKGISPKGFDRHANYNLGIREQVIFPEISIDKVSRLAGMNITFVTNTLDTQAAYQLLKALGMPFYEL
ncbi:MAG: 50S ribosomal protein L5 [Roseivirga sp.]